MLEIYLARSSEQGIWLKLPSSQAELGEAYAFLNGIDMTHTETFIGDVSSSADGLAGYLKGRPVDDHALRELDFLARRMEGMTAREQEIFGAAVQIDKPFSLMEIVNLSCNLNKFAFYPEIQTETQLGDYLIQKDYNKIPGELAALLDNESVGHKYAESHAGYFASTGYVVRTGEALEPLYDGKHLPDPDYEKNSCLNVYFYKGRSSHTLYLPVPDMELNYVKSKLGLDSLEDYRKFSVQENVAGLKDRLPCGCSIPELNRFAAVLKSALDGTERQRGNLLAALEAEAPATMERAIQVVEHLDEYRIVMKADEFQEPSDFAHKVLEDSDTYHVDGFTANFVDFTALGKAMMKAEGAIQTTLGIVMNDKHKISPLPETLTAFRLFSPLTANVFRNHGWEGLSDQPEEVYAGELCEYRDEIQKALKQECLDTEGERGLAVYIDDLLLARKVYSMNPTVEIWNEKLWGVLEVQTYGELSEGEWEELKEEWAGQCSDGFGEGFEQRPIKIREGELCVSFWQPGEDFAIRSEQELKGGASQGFGMQMGGM